MTTHKDTGARCLHVHYSGYGQCIVCECGAEVRPHQWREHIGAAVESLAAKREAEAAVIEKAKLQSDAGRRWETCTCGGRCAHEINYEMACSDTDFAVSTLRALEGDA
jgi:hypothetical protein